MEGNDLMNSLILRQCVHPEKTYKFLHRLFQFMTGICRKELAESVSKLVHGCWQKSTLHAIFVRRTDALNPCPISLLIVVFCLNIIHSSVTVRQQKIPFVYFHKTVKFVHRSTSLKFSSIYVLFPT
jgi:hypothetical protein